MTRTDITIDDILAMKRILDEADVPRNPMFYFSIDETSHHKWCLNTYTSGVDNNIEDRTMSNTKEALTAAQKELMQVREEMSSWAKVIDRSYLVRFETDVPNSSRDDRHARHRVIENFHKGEIAGQVVPKITRISNDMFDDGLTIHMDQDFKEELAKAEKEFVLLFLEKEQKLMRKTYRLRELLDAEHKVARVEDNTGTICAEKKTESMFTVYFDEQY